MKLLKLEWTLKIELKKSWSEKKSLIKNSMFNKSQLRISRKIPSLYIDLHVDKFHLDRYMN